MAGRQRSDGSVEQRFVLAYSHVSPQQLPTAPASSFASGKKPAKETAGRVHPNAFA
jgi:hypothetical protein